MNATAESIGPILATIPIDFRGNIENGQDEKELKDAIQIQLSSSSAKQTDIQAGNLTINTQNNTTLSGSHIQAEKGTISTGKLTEKELTHKGFEIAQRLDDGRDMWGALPHRNGEYGKPFKGIFTMDQIMKVVNSVGKIKEQPFESLRKIKNSLRLGDFKFKGDMHFSKATHQATISPNLDIKITNTNQPSSDIKRGEAQTQGSMQITKTKYKETDVKKLTEDAINGLIKVIKLKEDAEAFFDDIKK